MSPVKVGLTVRRRRLMRKPRNPVKLKRVVNFLLRFHNGSQSVLLILNTRVSLVLLIMPVKPLWFQMKVVTRRPSPVFSLLRRFIRRLLMRLFVVLMSVTRIRLTVPRKLKTWQTVFVSLRLLLKKFIVLLILLLLNKLLPVLP